MNGLKKDILVIDGQGGGLGRQIVSAIKTRRNLAVVTAVGTNSTATAAMLKAGADSAATGENAVVVACREADIIVGPIGIVIADSMLGEITPDMAMAVCRSKAKRILLPTSGCGNTIIGARELSMGRLLELLVQELELMDQGG